MRFLFVCNVVSVYLTPIIEYIAFQPENELILAFEWARKGNEIAGARKVKFKRSETKISPETIFDCWQMAAQNAKQAYRSFKTIAESGYEPDIIMQATQNGASLGLASLFPKAFKVSYLEKNDNSAGVVGKFRQQMQLIQAYESDLAFGFGAFSKKLRNLLHPGPLAVNTKFYRPLKSTDPENGDSVPARLFCLKGVDKEVFTRWYAAALDFALKSREKIILLLPDMQVLRRCMQQIEQNRLLAGLVTCVCNPLETEARDLFNRIKLFVWPGREIIPEILQAMSCGAMLCAKPLKNILLADFNCLPLSEYAKNVRYNENIGITARKTILENFALDKVLQQHMNMILEERKKHSA